MGHEGHEHDHDHHHDQDHDHHHHDHGGDEPDQHHHHHHPGARGGLTAGAGRGKVLFFDAPSGLAGDMIIAALVDLGVPADAVTGALACLPLGGYHVHFGRRVRSGVVGTSFEVHLETEPPPRDYAAIRRLLEASTLAPAVRARAERTFARLAAAEAKVHDAPIDAVHFHEVGGVDAIVDVVGSAAALEHLGAEVMVSPLPMGRGWVNAAHGRLPLPAPATVECLRGLTTYDGGLEFEFVTPTGAAIVGAHAAGSSRWPAMSPEHVGWGAGTTELSDRPNLLRAVLGAPGELARGEAPREASGSTHVVIETNVDDATGELAGACIEALLAGGALDAWATPITMKKGRPAITLSALALAEHEGAIAQVMLRESTSLGVRRYAVGRAERPRRIVRVQTEYGEIPVKVAEGPYGPPQVKPEFDACAAAARAAGVPVREVLRAALAAAGR